MVKSSVAKRPSIIVNQFAGILDAIGGTPLVKLQKVVPQGCAEVYAKLEFLNPTGSMKDRFARAVIEAAERDRRLKPAGTVVEYTSGSTGISLALVCAAKRYALKIVFSDAFSRDKRLAMEALGATILEVKSDGRRTTEKLIRKLVETAQQLSQHPGHWYCDQLTNHDGTAGYHKLGEEIWDQTNGGLNAFVQVVGTAHSIHGVTEALWRHNKDILIAAVEPTESAVLSGKSTGSHNIEGIGIGYVPPLWNPKLVNEIITVSTQEAKAMTRRLAKEEGLFVGISSGANIVASLKIAKRLGPAAKVATIMVDSGLRYLSTDLFQSP